MTSKENEVSQQQQKKPSGLGKKRALLPAEQDEDDATMFALPVGGEDEHDTEADPVGELDVMFDTFYVAMGDLGDKDRPEKELILLTRALVHESDRILRSGEGISDEQHKRVLEIQATALYHLGLYEEDKIQIDFVRESLSRFEELDYKQHPIYENAKLLTDIFDATFDMKSYNGCSLNEALLEFPACKEILQFALGCYASESCAGHHWLIMMADIAGDLDDSAKQKVASTIIEAMNVIQDSRILGELYIVYGGLLEALGDNEYKSAYRTAVNLLEGQSDLPSWVEEFLAGTGSGSEGSSDTSGNSKRTGSDEDNSDNASQ